MTRYAVFAATLTAAMLWSATHPERIEHALAWLLRIEDV